MNAENLLIISGKEVDTILAHKEKEILEVVKQAYIAHSNGQSSLPHSTFLRFPDQPKDRIIGLPAYINGQSPTAGIKWIASFPDNITRGLERASAAIILNSTETGQPYSFMEGSIISAKRTAASAAVAASALSRGEQYKAIGLIGCGLINSEVFKFVSSIFSNLEDVYLYDLDKARAQQFAQKIQQVAPRSVHICESIEEVFQASTLISLATTAGTPYIEDPALLQSNAVVLHVSLRDLGTNIITASTNIVDDLDHVNRENTSIYLTAQKLGKTDFVLGNIGEVLEGKKQLPNTGPIIFSPFGLGVLDMALARYVYEEASSRGIGLSTKDFIPQPWNDQNQRA